MKPEFWVNGQGAFTKNPAWVASGYVTPWGVEPMTANWACLADMRAQGVRIQPGFSECLASDGTVTLQFPDKYDYIETFESVLRSGRKLMILFGYGPRESYGGWATEIDDLGYSSANSFHNSRPPAGDDYFVWDTMRDACIQMLSQAKAMCAYYELDPIEVLSYQFWNEAANVTKSSSLASGVPTAQVGTGGASSGATLLPYTGVSSGYTGAVFASANEEKYICIGDLATRFAVRCTAAGGTNLTVQPLTRAVTATEPIRLLDYGDLADGSDNIVPLDSLFWDMCDYIAPAIIAVHPEIKFATPSVFGLINRGANINQTAQRVQEFNDRAATSIWLDQATWIAANVYVAQSPLRTGYAALLPEIRWAMDGIRQAMEGRPWKIMITEFGLRTDDVFGTTPNRAVDDYQRGQSTYQLARALMAEALVDVACLYVPTSISATDDASTNHDYAMVDSQGNAKPAWGGFVGKERTDLVPDGYKNEGEVIAPYSADFPGFHRD
jgi:hypothetical protein